MPKTQEEIDRLKADWKSDPCWDIEDTEGFENHREELVKYRHEVEREQEHDRYVQVSARASVLSCNVHLAQYTITLENKISALEEKLERLADRVELYQSRNMVR